MPIDDTEVAALARADFGETLTVDGVAVTGTLVLGVPQTADEPAGIDRRRHARARLPLGTAVAVRSRIVQADGTTWAVDASPDTEYGELVCSVVRASRQTEGRL